VTGPARDPSRLSPEEVQSAVAEIKRELAALEATAPERLDLTPETMEKGLARLVLSLVELLRRLLERQAIRRMEGGGLTDQQVNDMGDALMKLEQKIRELAQGFGLDPDDLDLRLMGVGELDPSKNQATRPNPSKR
jgi:hypothetical protein